MKTITHEIIIKRCLFLMVFLIQSFVFSQTQTNILESSSIDSSVITVNGDEILSKDTQASCSAKDFILEKLYLGDANGAPLGNSCTPGSTVAASIYAYFDGPTNADRYSLYMDYDIYINGVYSSHVNTCLYTGQVVPIRQNLKLTDISWQCGDRVELKNFYMAWQTTPGKPCSTHPSKCYFNGEGYHVDAPLIANFSSTTTCDSYKVDFTSTTTGGDTDHPYTYKWDINNNGSVEYTTANPSHTFPGPGTYSVKLTVNDYAGKVDSQIYSITVNSLLQNLSLTTTNIACNASNTGAITASGVTGGDGNYTYSISPVPTGYIQNGAQFTNLSAGTYTVTVTDGSGCSVSATATITMTEGTTPAITAPANLSVEGCSIADIKNNETTALDFSATPISISTAQFETEGGTFVEENVDTITYQDTASGSCPIVITRTFTITNDCGLSATATQTINIADSVAPVFAALPAPSTIECGVTPNFAQASVSDACGSDLTLTFEDVTTDGECEGAYAITRTWTATDACGNTSTAFQTINVEDNTAPVFAALPAESTIECGETPNFAQASAIDACGSEVTLTFEDVTTPGSTAGVNVITRTWTATDACGNSSTASQTINVQDSTAPVFAALPAPSTIECGETPNFAQASTTDACGAEVTLTFEDVTTPGECEGSYAITRTWTATDAYGNASTASQTINVEDNTAPVFAALPAESTIECGVTPNFAQASATDACGSEVTLTFEDVTAPGSTSGVSAITRTWTATDACGNTSTASQTINVQDNTAPVFAALPTPSTIECSETPNFAQATATDACSLEVTLTFEDVTTPGECEGSYTITRTWTATDAYGNASTASQIINVEDNTAPVFAALPAPSTIECGETPNFAQASATDACGSEVTLTFEDVTTPGSTAGVNVITRTWTATDACGNASTASQTINVQDNTAPVFAALPAPSTIECGETPEFAQATATDECGSEVTLTFEDVTTPGECEGSYAITRTWTATDANGNASTASQTITVQDNTAPVFAALPAPSTIECGETPNFAQASATDACGSEVTLTFEDVTTDGECAGAYTITRTWTATDACGNASTASQTINVQDITAPVFAALPAPSTIECSETPNFAQASVTDACGSDVTLTFEDVTTDGECGGAYAITRTWTATDTCGNTSTASQTINVQDNTAPVINTIATDLVVECDGNGNSGAFDAWLNSNGGATATDACSTNLTWSNNYDGSTSDCSKPVVVTFTVIDECGNACSTTATYTIQDSHPPVITAAADVTVESDGKGNKSDLQTWLENNGGATATDDCSAISWSNNFTSLSDLCGATGAATVTFTATDACGNSDSTTATFTIVDTTAPIISPLPDVTTIECTETPNFAPVTAIDSCGSPVTLSFQDVTTPGECDNTYSITRTWTATDFCGNATTASQTINVEDTTAPVFAALPAESTIECSETPNFAQANATDACGSEVTLTYEDVTTDGECAGAYSITRTWTATDSCGNASTALQTINVQDTTAPVFAALPAESTIECGETPNFAQASVTDACGTEVTLTFEDITTDGECAGAYAITRTWTATDSCGNASTASQTINVQDTTAPVFAALPAESTIECGETPNFAQASVTDACGSEVTLTFEDITTDGECAGAYAITRTWTATDSCGNVSTASQTINVEDNTAPVFAALPAESTIECGETPNFAQATATDACGSEVTLTFEDVTTTGSTAGVSAITRTWTATDTCGNSSTASQTINVQDNTAPVFAALPAESTIECGETPNFAQASATDVCSSDVTLTFEDVTTAGDCEGTYSITRTWTATDAYGNASTASQTINVQDTTAPVFAALPAESTIECGVTPNFAQASATDACGSEVTLTFEDVTTDGECAGSYAITRTWTATDACGNASTASQTINVQDTTAPVFAALPAESTIECGVTPNFAQATATDACGADVTLTFEDVTTDGECAGAYSITRTWTATDACGNASTASQTINVQDMTAPVIAALPAESTIECGVTPNFAQATATDACGSDVTLTFEDVTTDGECAGAYSITRTWTATDSCGNASTASQTINVQDNTAPVFAALPAASTIECGVTPNFAQASATDACGSDVTLTFEDVTTDGECAGAYSITRTWTATDACGNASTASQTINVQDMTAPVIAALPAESTVDCGVTPNFAQATATDACGSDVTLTFEDVTTDGECAGAYSITRTWTATDACGNASTASQTINVQDMTAPVIAALPAESTVDCGVTPNFAQATATDACGSDVTLTFEDVTTDGECAGAYSITRTWTATDACGNASTASQTINVQDMTAPVIAALPAESTVDCGVTPNFAQATATDACGSDVTLTFEDVTTDGECAGAYSITRTWTATDACGNASTASQTINVQDMTAPSLVTEYDTEITISCDNIPAAPELVFEDSCSSNINVAFTETSTATDSASSYVITRTWTVSDTCGNEAAYTQTINVNPAAAITVTDTELCNGDDLNFDLFDLLSGTYDTNGTWSVVAGNTSLDGSLFNPYQLEIGTYTFKYTLADDYCTSETLVNITLNDDCVVLPCGAEDVVISRAVTTYADGKNDFFTVTGVETCGFTVELQIFNRWGALIYESKNYQNDWNGTSSKASVGNSNYVPTGTYYYIVNLKNSGLKPFTGPIYVATK
ncbi:gliding motility-associated C-terminal domain-containing protein [uncultured Gelidibacter sp.]|uniref:HYR-like domain-containing protein n=1 Tax=uncultured Gelidibacter sp. TaxID=259318 RepID=UPI00262A9659|nr:gliding motility-associated C-terminal domain-containing protein [uncultured Gelidibacter sp.]